MITGTFLLVFGFCMLSLATQYYQFFLCQSLPIAVGMNLVWVELGLVASVKLSSRFIAPVGVVGQWFAKRRGLAL